LERVKGIEHFTKNTELVDSTGDSQAGKSDYAQIRAHAAGANRPTLARVAAVWSKLPAPLKAAILAIVNSSAGVQ
jgi:hypothetical protein